MSEKPVVCLDPGHGPDTVNGSPDGIYKEREFTWDMYKRIRPLMEAQGIYVVGTRSEDSKPSLTERARISNEAGADLFISIHSNAAGNDGWSDASGLLIYTSAAGEDAPRNIAARDILEQMRLAGVKISGSGLFHCDYTVLVKTNAPAVLIEYGFHTNEEEVGLLRDGAYRNKLAVATTKGACDFLGISYQSPDVAPWAADAWKKAVDLGIFDGTRPADPLTRQECAVVLDRLHLL